MAKASDAKRSLDCLRFRVRSMFSSLIHRGVFSCPSVRSSSRARRRTCDADQPSQAHDIYIIPVPNLGASGYQSPGPEINCVGVEHGAGLCLILKMLKLMATSGTAECQMGWFCLEPTPTGTLELSIPASAGRGQHYGELVFTLATLESVYTVLLFMPWKGKDAEDQLKSHFGGGPLARSEGVARIVGALVILRLPPLAPMTFARAPGNVIYLVYKKTSVKYPFVAHLCEHSHHELTRLSDVWPESAHCFVVQVWLCAPGVMGTPVGEETAKMTEYYSADIAARKESCQNYRITTVPTHVGSVKGIEVVLARLRECSIRHTCIR
ncbi:hypothetical protein EDB92DRAFT_1814011 [Lactarius akahatsu]|uniref:Uncharacterized protein n=1 Tax=Lactarius akahatsu TaxID=416441 RepID=A0AAD4LQB9_9AGAM|nr:hypothetical protein EDB92DRAFT_1814011 [Lactarius akahatsu]